jgi:CRISPR-associated protein Csh2
MSEIIKSEILFLYESKYNLPNGDPFTGEQRYDEETKKILISDVRIKRFIRTYLEDIENLPIYVSEKTGAGKTDAKGVLTWILSNRNPNNLKDVGEVLKEQIDVRLFGGISTLDDKFKIKEKEFINGHVQYTGPVQFALLNPSLNKVDLRMHQNTTHFKSKAENAQGSIGTTTVVPYAINQIHGWVNPKSAEETGMTNEDLLLMLKSLWYGTSGNGSSHSRSKIGQDSLLLLEIQYTQNNKKVYGVDKLITIVPNKNISSEAIRSTDDFTLKFDELHNAIDSDKVIKVRYFTELENIEKGLENSRIENKLEKLQF